MRKYYFITSALVLGTMGLQAQTITSTDFPAVNDYIWQAKDMSLGGTGVIIGSTGAGQTWNFQGMGDDGQDTIIFLSTSAGTASSSFPQTTIVAQQSSLGSVINIPSAVLQQEGSGELYLKVDAS